MPTARKGNLFIFSGPSGAGKGTLVKALLRRVPDAWVSVSVTTRAPRPGEVDGVSYHFLSDHEFVRMRDAGGLLEYSQHFSHAYGTPREPVERAMAAGKQVILEIDVNGARQVCAAAPYAVPVFIEPPSKDELVARLRGRGTETEEQIHERINRVDEELAHKTRYNHVVVNDDLARATDELVALIDRYAGQPA